MNEKKQKKKMKKMLKTQKNAVKEIFELPRIRKLVAEALMISKKDCKKKKKFKAVMGELASYQLNSAAIELERGMMKRAKDRKSVESSDDESDIMRHFENYSETDPDDDRVIHKMSHNQLLQQVSKKLSKK